MRPRFLATLLLILVAATAVAVQVGITVDAVQELAAPQARARLPVQLDSMFRVEAIHDRAAAGQLEVGDRWLAIDDVALHASGPLMRRLAAGRPGESLTVRFARATGVVESANVSLIALRPAAPPLSWWLFTSLLRVLLPWFCLALGLWVVAIRRHDSVAWALLGLMLSFSQLGWTDLEAVRGWPVPWGAWGCGYSVCVSQLWAVFMPLFGLGFAERLKFDKRYPWCKWLLLGPLCAWALLIGVTVAVGLDNPGGLSRLTAFVNRWQWVAFAASLGSISLFFMALGMKAGAATDPDARRRARIVAVGSSVGLTPGFVLLMLSLWLGRSFPDDWPVAISLPVLVLYLLLPLTLAYVIVVHRALDVRVVVRQGLQYALAARGVFVIQIVAVLVVILPLFIIAADVSNDLSRPRRVQLMALGTLFVVLLRFVADKARRWVDRKFFREAYDAEQILAGLSEEVGTMVEAPQLLATVADRLSQTLHVTRVAIFTKEANGFRCALARGFERTPELQWPADSPVVVALAPPAGALRVGRDTLAERAKLDELQSELLLPLSSKGELHGFVSLGPKRAEAAYSASDIRILQSVAHQTGLALANAQMAERIATDAAQRMRITREVEIAREVQERLFPQTLPQIAGLDLGGRCRSALGVGGDYYDFFTLADGKLALAIGDVSGKGIGAALLMASLRAAVHGQALAPQRRLGPMIAAINNLLCESSTSNRYATFFYGEFDPETKRLHYVNAGHNPPVLLRGGADPPRAERLDVGGMVVGLIEQVPFAEGEVLLQPGDLLLGYTDGISEARNAADDEWGEAALIAALTTARRHAAPTAAELIDELFAQCDRFVAGAPQHDDMTIILLQLARSPI